MARFRHLFFIAALFAIVTAIPGNRAVAQIQGQFDTIGVIPPPHSLKTVSWDEYLNFTCPHCNNFRTAYVPLKKKYGSRVGFRNVPVLFKGQSDAVIRLFFIGQQAGREEEIKNIIFDATFKYGVNINDPAIITYLAKSTGLGAQYEKEAHSDWVNQKLQQSSDLAQSVYTGIGAA